ncbi:MAG: cation:proton antiporter [Gemmatimonadetes bacterium]|nr:cation:proton antiporter [Gemmatimonadota bacterium]
MSGLAILLAGAAVGLGIAKWLNLPSIPLLLVTGIALSIAGLLPATDLLADMLVLGLTVLVFVAGVELNPRRVGLQKGVALRVGAAQFAVLATLGMVAALALGFTVSESMYLALALTASSTLVVVRILRQRKQLFEPFGRLVIGVLLLQDMLVILLIPVVMNLPDGALAAMTGFLGALALTGLALVSLRWVTPYLLTRLQLDEEGVLLTTLAFLFVYIGLADLLGLPLVAGAFLAGVSLSSFPVSGVVRGQLNSLSDFFLAIFFTALGGILVIPSLAGLLQTAVLIGLVLLATPPLVTLVAERAGLSARPALESGLLLAQTSEFSLVVGLQALAMAHIDQEIFSIIALVTVTTMILTPFISTDAMTWRLMAFHPMRRGGVSDGDVEDHILLLGCGDSGMPLLETIVSAGHNVLVIDDDPAVIARLREGDIPSIRGDGADIKVLRAAGARRARLIISTMRRQADHIVVLDHVEGVPLLARVFEPGDADTIRAHGGSPVLYSHATADTFLAWLDQADEVGVERERRTQAR